MSFTVRPADLPAEADALLGLASRAQEVDGVAAFNEESTFAVTRPSELSRVLVAVDADQSGTPVAVLVDAHGDASGVDLVTEPARRREGAGSALLDAVVTTAAHAGLWAHGDLTPARSFARHHGLTMARDLWMMTRAVTPGESFDTALPDGFVARRFDGSEEQAAAWLSVNAEAFAHHPEQGRMTMADFRERMQEDWFDAEGLILVWHEESGRLAASHWTKREPGSTVGEVYVVAVAPQFQGRGLAAPLTALGLEHLAASGVTQIDLYVEGDNEPAKATYTKRGFERSAHDVMYVHDAS